MQQDTQKEEEKRIKQNYLKEEIFNDPLTNTEKFTNFLEATKPEVDATDVNNWTLSELIQVVQDFKYLEFTLISTLKTTKKSNPKPKLK